MDIKKEEKLFNVTYIFDENEAEKELKLLEENYLENQKRKNKLVIIENVLWVIFILVAIVFVSMAVATIIAPIMITKSWCKPTLGGFALVLTALMSFLMYFGHKIDILAVTKLTDLYTFAEKFLVFKNENKKIIDARVYSEDSDTAILNIFYEEDDAECGKITKCFTYNDIDVVKLNGVKEPVLDINGGIFYLPLINQEN